MFLTRYKIHIAGGCPDVIIAIHLKRDTEYSCPNPLWNHNGRIFEGGMVGCFIRLRECYSFRSNGFWYLGTANLNTYRVCCKIHLTADKGALLSSMLIIKADGHSRQVSPSLVAVESVLSTMDWALSRRS